MKELPREEIDEVLVRNGVGVLALIDEGVPYAIPMSFGYQGDEMAFAMHGGPDMGGEKPEQRSQIRTPASPSMNGILMTRRLGGV